MALKINSDMPELQRPGMVTINGSLQAQPGQPALVHFWSVSCGVCSEQMPQVVKWVETYGPRGLGVYGVHMPRSEKDLDIGRVQEAVTSYGLRHPIGVDNEHTLVDAFTNQYVPAFYVFDRNGHLRLFQAGEKGLPMVEKALERVLAPPDEADPQTG